MTNEQARGPYLSSNQPGKVIFELPNNACIVVCSNENTTAATATTIAKTALLVKAIPGIIAAAANLRDGRHPSHGPDDPCEFCDAVRAEMKKAGIDG